MASRQRGLNAIVIDWHRLYCEVRKACNERDGHKAKTGSVEGSSSEDDVHAVVAEMIAVHQGVLKRSDAKSPQEAKRIEGISRHLDSYDEAKQFALGLVLTRKASRARSARRHTEALEKQGEPPVAIDSFLDGLADREEKRLFVEVLKADCAHFQLGLYFIDKLFSGTFEDMSRAEIATAMGLSDAEFEKVRRRVCRAARRVQKSLQKRGIGNKS